MKARISKLWNRMDLSTKLAAGCFALYLSMYVVVDIAEEIARLIVMILT